MDLEMVLVSEAFRRIQATFFGLYLITTREACSDFKRIVASLPVGQIKVESKGEVVWMPAGPPAHLLNRSAISQSVIKRRSQCVGNKTNSVKKVAFPGTILANKKH
jgi:hypothetical protein